MGSDRRERKGMEAVGSSRVEVTGKEGREQEREERERKVADGRGSNEPPL